ncbi:MAG TPA: DUF4402 domain-containing protein [Sphingomicrobium sp.]|nr:DUF4402 domain-containing protein [Sphingomicrobium sp.]
MPGPRLALIPLAVALAAVIGQPRPALAQCRLCDTPETAAPEREDDRPLEIAIDADLDFDRLLLASNGSGRARLGPDGTRLASGAIASIGGRAMVARVTVRGMPGRPVSIDLPARVELLGLKGGRLVIEQLISDLGDQPKLDSNGELTFRIGGELTLDGEADGDYRGSVPIAVDYL